MKCISIFFISFLFLGLFGCKAGEQEFLNPKEFQSKIEIEKVQLIDIRTPQEFELGYIEGAVNIDFYHAAFIESMAKLDKEKPLALYCKSGGRTKDALRALSKEGFKTIYALNGGLLSWEKDGFTLIIPKPPEPTKTTVTIEQFDQIIRSEKLVIIDFGAVWCGPCKMLKPVLDKLSLDYASKNVKIVAIDVDDSKALSTAMKVNEIPLILFYKNGILVERMIGFNPEETIKATIAKYTN